MIIVLLLFFKSICLYCQRLVLHVHDRWINPKNVRLLKEAAEAKGTKFQIEEYRQVKKSKKTRYASTSPQTNSLADSASCNFCANTPQGYCRHHFHLQELHVQKQQRQQKFWCPLSGVVSGSNSPAEYRQLRKIKRELKRTIQQQQQKHKTTRPQIILCEHSAPSDNFPEAASPPSATYHRSPSSHFSNDSGYQTNSLNSSAPVETTNIQTDSSSASAIISNTSHDHMDIELISPAASFAQTPYSFETCCGTPRRSRSSIPTTKSINNFASCEYSALSTSSL